MVVRLSPHTALEPDVLMIRTERSTGHDQVIFQPCDVLLGWKRCSRRRRNGERVVPYTFELDHQDGRYRPTGTFVNRLTTDQPYPVDIDLTELDGL